MTEVPHSQDGLNQPLEWNYKPAQQADESKNEIRGGKAGFTGSVFNVMNGILGCGIVGLPFFVTSLGWFGFTVTLLFVASFALFTIDLLLQICVKYRTTVYEDIAEEAFGRPGRVYTSFVIALSCLIAQVAFLFIVRKNIVGIFQGIGNYLPSCAGAASPHVSFLFDERNDKYMMLIVLWCVVAPLTIPKQINFLGRTSGVAMVGMMIFAVMLIVLKSSIEYPLHKNEMASNFLYNYYQNTTGNASSCDLAEDLGYDKNTRDYLKNMDYRFNVSKLSPEDIPTLPDHQVDFNMNDKIAWLEGKDTLSSIAGMIFAFQCHASALPIYTEQRVPTRSNFLKVAITAVTAVFLIYWASAMSAAHTFYDMTSKQVMAPYVAMSQNNPYILIARLTIVNCVTLSAPLLLYTGRKTLVMLFAKKGSIYLEEIKGRDAYIKKHLGWSFVNLVLVSILVCVLPDMGPIFDIGGAVTANSIVVILPTAFYYKLIIHSNPESSKFARLIYPCITLSGLLLMIYMLLKAGIAFIGDLTK